MSCLAIGLALSMHLGLANEYNQIHPYAKCETDKTITGIYYNSLENISLFGAMKYKLTDELLLDIGIATGYVYDVVPMARLRYKNIFIMPAMEEDATGVVLGIQVDF